MINITGDSNGRYTRDLQSRINARSICEINILRDDNIHMAFINVALTLFPLSLFSPSVLCDELINKNNTNCRMLLIYCIRVTIYRDV